VSLARSSERLSAVTAESMCQYFSKIINPNMLCKSYMERERERILTEVSIDFTDGDGTRMRKRRHVRVGLDSLDCVWDYPSLLTEQVNMNFSYFSQYVFFFWHKWRAGEGCKWSLLAKKYCFFKKIKKKKVKDAKLQMEYFG
jgi:hypothetical protein